MQANPLNGLVKLATKTISIFFSNWIGFGMDLNQVGRYRPGHLSAVSSCATMHVHLLFAALNNLSPLYIWECPSNIPRNILLIGQFEKNILTRDISLVTSPQEEKCPIV